MFELRYLRTIQDSGHQTDILQYRVKDQHRESSTTTPLPYGWSEWLPILIVEEYQVIKNDSSLTPDTTRAIKEIEKKLLALKSTVKNLNENEILSLMDLTMAVNSMEATTKVLREKIDEFGLERFSNTED